VCVYACVCVWCVCACVCMCMYMCVCVVFCSLGVVWAKCGRVGVCLCVWEKGTKVKKVVGEQ
jgi:hypothetical protein